MRKAVTETGMPMLVPEYKFLVYFDQGCWQIESYREGNSIDRATAYTAVDAGYEMRLILEGEGPC
jgi:hypothetical protein